MAHYAIQQLDSAIHHRNAFDCGVEPLNRYLRDQAGQDLRRFACGCWVLIHQDDPNTILGYYTLSPEAVEAKELPDSRALRKKLPHYPRLGAILLGRLAISAAHQGKGLGKKVLFDAISRCARSEIRASLLVVDAKDEDAEAFYSKYGFEPLTKKRLFYPIPALQSCLD